MSVLWCAAAGLCLVLLSLGRVSVPVWLLILSDQPLIVLAVCLGVLCRRRQAQCMAE